MAKYIYAVPIYCSVDKHAEITIQCTVETKKRNAEDVEYVAIVNRCDEKYRKEVLGLFDRVIYNDVNCLAKAWNIALVMFENSDSEFLVVANSDIIVGQNGIADLHHTLLSAGDFSVIGPSFCGDRPMQDHHGVCGKNKFLETSRECKHRFEEVPGLYYALFGVTRRFVEEHGYFDEVYQPVYHLDVDMNRRFRLQGKKAILATDTFVWHYGSYTVKTDRTHPGSAPTAKMYIKKWGGDIGREKYTTPYNSGGDVNAINLVGIDKKNILRGDDMEDKKDFCIVMNTVARDVPEQYFQKTLRSLLKSGILESKSTYDFHIVYDGTPEDPDYFNGVPKEWQIHTYQDHDSEMPRTESLFRRRTEACRIASESNTQYSILIQDDVQVCKNFLDEVKLWIDKYFTEDDSFVDFHNRKNQNTKMKNVSCSTESISPFYCAQCICFRTADIHAIAVLPEKLIHWDIHLGNVFRSLGYKNCLVSYPSYVQHGFGNNYISAVEDKYWKNMMTNNLHHTEFYSRCFLGEDIAPSETGFLAEVKKNDTTEQDNKAVCL